MKFFRFFLLGLFVILTSSSVEAQRGFFYSHIPDWDYSHVDSSIQLSIMQDTAVLTDEEIKAMIRLPQSELPQPSDEEIKAQLEAIPALVNFQCNDQVIAEIRNMVYSARNYMAKLRGRAEYYFPFLEGMLAQEEMPIELKYLTLIESGLDPQITSYAGARGLWQIMPATARGLGLTLDSWVDERCDPIKSTQAALAYLKAANRTYDDWLVSLASYNAGPGTVNRAISRTASGRTYWDIQPQLPRETQKYVPKYIAMVYLMHYADYYKIPIIYPSYSIAPSIPVEIFSPLKISHIAAALDMDSADLARLNPSLKTDWIPYYQNGFTLNVPSDKSARFYALEQDIYLTSDTLFFVLRDDRVNGGYDERKNIYYVQQGDYLEKIAMNFSVSVEELMEWNELESMMLKLGQGLVVGDNKGLNPYVSDGERPDEVGMQSDEYDENCDCVYHRVRFGESIFDIAYEYGVRVEDILRDNTITNVLLVEQGINLKIPKN
ncbi:MAG: LysM peptidoglycan-binding domain-containing protein [Bacteroidetes bacterium]|nr:MAG: LysM peptidoglycan-binding domain-containing protein [Bacteroidota bacterium]